MLCICMANPDGKNNTKNSNNHGCKMDFNGFTNLQNYFNGITPALKLRKATNIGFKHNNFRVEMHKYCYQTYLVLGVLSLRIFDKELYHSAYLERFVPHQVSSLDVGQGISRGLPNENYIHVHEHVLYNARS